MHLTQEEVRHVAELAKLRLTGAEVRQYAAQLSAILDYAERIQRLIRAACRRRPMCWAWRM